MPTENDVFSQVVGPSLERLPIARLSQNAGLNGRRFIVNYTISKVVLTDFDRKLSEHLAAVRGSGFPGVSLEISVTELASKETWHPAPEQFLKSIPHALKRVAEYAMGDRARASLVSVPPTSEAAGEAPDAEGPRWDITVDRVDAIAKSLDLCGTLGAFEFLQVSADYDRITVKPHGDELDPVVIDLERGTVSIPPLSDRDAVFECSLFSFTRELSGNRAAAAYVARARHNLSLAKEEAIYRFRSSAQDRIMGFDRALAGRPLDSFRLDAAVTLVSRLKAGLGDSLVGLSEEAQITALEWAASINARRKTEAQANSPNSAYPFRTRRIGGSV